MAQYQVTGVITRSLALHTQAVLQDSVVHLKRYLTLLFR